MTTHKQYQHDVLIIGSGAAGLSLALQLAELANIAILAKDRLSEGATRYAQGGVSAVLDSADSVESHVADTLSVGAGLSDPEIVRYVVEQGESSIEWLQSNGVQFTENTDASSGSTYHLHKEGGHSHRRIVHADDATGETIQLTLLERVQQHPNIHCFEEHTAVNLIIASGPKRRCVGAYVLEQQTGDVQVFSSRVTILASGGAGKAYLYTSNPDICTGDGIAMAWRANCRIANMEFVQFHPTCLYHPQAKSFLISEALRGEGGKLILKNGEPFMSRFDERLELAPRDIVARAIDYEMKRLGDPYVMLDITHQPAAFIQQHFPTIHTRCLDYGIDICTQPIPVVPAAHYTCGGVLIDKHGCTDLPALYAIGEVSCSKLHGANRMASNSLLECVVFARACYKHIAIHLADYAFANTILPWDESRVTDSDEEVVVAHNWEEIRRFMWDYVGIVRSTKRLQRAQRRIELLQHEIMEYYSHFKINRDLVELRNLAVVAHLIIHAALSRKESRGLHYTLDYPTADMAQPGINTVMRRGVDD